MRPLIAAIVLLPVAGCVDEPFNVPIGGTDLFHDALADTLTVGTVEIGSSHWAGTQLSVEPGEVRVRGTNSTGRGAWSTLASGVGINISELLGDAIEPRQEIAFCSTNTQPVDIRIVAIVNGIREETRISNERLRLCSPSDR